MNHTKLTRRIDGLGRIVIPKEIRDNLGITEGELLEINVMNSEILLSKYSKLDDKISLIETIADNLASNFGCKIVITDRSKVIYSNIENLKGKEISLAIKNHINNRSNTNISNLEVSNKEILEGEYSLMTIIKDSDSLGICLVSSLNNELSQKITKVITSIMI